MKRADIWRAACAVALVVPMPVWASEHAEGGKAGLPQLDVALYPGILFWVVVIFSLFFLFMWAVGVPGVQKTRDNRAAILNADLSSARAASEEAQKVVADYELALAQARQQAQATVNEIIVAASKEAEIHGQKMHNELTHRIQVAEENIAQSRQKAMEDAPKQVNTLVLDLFERVTQVELGTSAAEARS